MFSLCEEIALQALDVGDELKPLELAGKALAKAWKRDATRFELRRQRLLSHYFPAHFAKSQISSQAVRTRSWANPQK